MWSISIEDFLCGLKNICRAWNGLRTLALLKEGLCFASAHREEMKFVSCVYLHLFFFFSRHFHLCGLGEYLTWETEASGNARVVLRLSPRKGNEACVSCLPFALSTFISFCGLGKYLYRGPEALKIKGRSAEVIFVLVYRKEIKSVFRSQFPLVCFFPLYLYRRRQLKVRTQRSKQVFLRFSDGMTVTRKRTNIWFLNLSIANVKVLWVPSGSLTYYSPVLSCYTEWSFECFKSGSVWGVKHLSKVVCARDSCLIMLY